MRLYGYFHQNCFNPDWRGILLASKMRGRPPHTRAHTCACACTYTHTHANVCSNAILIAKLGQYIHYLWQSRQKRSILKLVSRRLYMWHHLSYMESFYVTKWTEVLLWIQFSKITSNLLGRNERQFFFE